MSDIRENTERPSDGHGRRDFLRRAALALGAGAAGIGARAGDARAQDSETPDAAGIPVRTLGATGAEVTILGLGGTDVGRARMDEAEAVAVVRRAIDAGVTYLDTARQYGNGVSETRYGKALKEAGAAGERCFVATKTLHRSKDAADREIAGSLRRLGRCDLLQIHAINDMETLDRVCADDGSLAAAREYLDRGDVKHLGITGHTRPEVLIEALDRFDFETVLVPLGPADEHRGCFLEELVPKAREKDCGIIAMKVYAMGRAVGGADGLDPAACLRYAMGLPVSTVIVGMGTAEHVDANVAVARDFEPLPAAERKDLVAAAAEHQGRLWWKNTD